MFAMRYRCAAIFVAALCAWPSQAENLYFPLSGRTVSVVLDRVARTDVMVITGQVPRSGTGAISHEIRFTAPSNELRSTVTWNVYNRTRFVGVNVDLSTSDGALVTTDAFAGTLAGRAAVSTLDTSSLTANQVYTLKISGTQTSALNYAIAIEFGPP